MTTTDSNSAAPDLPSGFASILLCGLFPVVLVLSGIPLPRDGMLTDVAGLFLCAGMAVPAWWLATAGKPLQTPSLSGLTGLLLIAPFLPVSLLWVGLGTPWDATPEDNQMRYAVLAVAAVLMTSASLAVDRLTRSASAGGWTIAVQTGALIAGSTYVTWSSFQWGFHAMRGATDTMPEAAVVMNNILDVQLFVAGALTYLTNILVARLLHRAGWLSRRAGRAQTAFNSLLLLLLVMRGVAFPVPGAGPAPWYLEPGFIAGIPAVPWILPFFMGVGVLKRAGTRRSP